MAIEIMTVGGVEDAKAGGQRVVNNLMQITQATDIKQLIAAVIMDLEVAIKTLQGKEQQFCLLFEDCKDINDFKTKFKRYYNEQNLYQFTGSSLRPIIEEYKSRMNKDQQEYVKMLNQMIYNLSNNLVKGLELDVKEAFNNKKVTTEIKAEILNILLSTLSQFKGSGSRGDLTSTRFAVINASNNTNNYGALEVASSLINESFKKRLDVLRTESRKIPGRGKKTEEEKARIVLAKQLIKGYRSSHKSSSQSLSDNFIINWTDIIQEYTKDKTGKGTDFKGTAEELEKANIYITNQILNQLNLPSDLRGYAEKKINDTLKLAPTMYFTGRAETQVEGILGEINTVIALIHLMGRKYADRALLWVGGQKTTIGSKAQPSIDIIIRDIMGVSGIDFGIQVKNTMTDLNDGFLHEITFAKGDIHSIFNKLGIGYDDLINVLTSDVFNVPYKKRGTDFIQVDNGPHHTNALFDVYRKLDKDIDDIVAKINIYLSSFAPDFLYMGIDQSVQSKLATLDQQITQAAAGNFVYVVGSEVFFASEMLMQLQEDLSLLQKGEQKLEQLSFQLKVDFDTLENDIGNTHNIVSVLNGRTSILGHTTKLTSSWKFHR